MHKVIYVTTCLLICGENIDTDLINEKLRFPPTRIRIKRKGEESLPSIENGASRNYDIRLSLDNWRGSLTNKQHKFDLVKQLEFWIEKLDPVRSAFIEFKELDYWCVIDCQLASTDTSLPSIQFRLTNEMLSKLSKLNLDLDFTVNRSTA